jgi:tetratricopeptide (TPR) repeat protein
MEMIKLVVVDWVSCEREKYIWEDLYGHSWDEIIGRMYLLKAHEFAEDGDYREALVEFEQALTLLSKDGVRRSYYCNALADKALIQCFLGQYQEGLATYNQAFALAERDDERAWLADNRGALLVLAGFYSEALELLQEQIEREPRNDQLRFTWATCLLHMERYDEAAAAYEQVLAQHGGWYKDSDEGLKAARWHEQPDWETIP